jgi:hypothetical protein
LLLVLRILRGHTDSPSSTLQPIDGPPPLSLLHGPCRMSSSTSICSKLSDYSNGSTNVTALPLACPQPDVDSSTYSEDCLSMILYVPITLTPTSSASTLVWFFLFTQCIFCHFLIRFQGSRRIFHRWFCNRPGFGRLKTCSGYKLYSSRHPISLGSRQLTSSFTDCCLYTFLSLVLWHLAGRPTLHPRILSLPFNSCKKSFLLLVETLRRLHWPVKAVVLA